MANMVILEGQKPHPLRSKRFSSSLENLIEAGFQLHRFQRFQSYHRELKSTEIHIGKNIYLNIKPFRINMQNVNGSTQFRQYTRDNIKLQQVIQCEDIDFIIILIVGHWSN